MLLNIQKVIKCIIKFAYSKIKCYICIRRLALIPSSVIQKGMGVLPNKGGHDPPSLAIGGKIAFLKQEECFQGIV